MIVIKNSEELAKLVTAEKDLIVEDDVRIEFSPIRQQLRDVKCYNLFLLNDAGDKFDFNSRNFTGWNFIGGDISYYAFFNCYGGIKCKSIKGRREPHSEPVCLDGELEIIEKS